MSQKNHCTDNKHLLLYKRFSCQVDIEYNAGQVAVHNAVIKSTEKWCSTSDRMKYNHAVTLLVSVYQKICPMPINTDKNHFVRGNGTANQLVGVTGRINLQ